MFLNLPIDGWPVVIDAHPTDREASDLLGGAIPVHVGVDLTAGIGVLVREDCRSMPLNLAASYVCSRVTGSPVAVLGPAILVRLDTLAAAGVVTGDKLTGAVLGDMACFDAKTAAALSAVAQDAVYASKGLDDRLSPSSHDRYGHRARLMRTLFEVLAMVAEDLPQDFPDARYERGDLTADTSDTAATSDPRFII